MYITDIIEFSPFWVMMTRESNPVGTKDRFAKTVFLLYFKNILSLCKYGSELSQSVHLEQS